MVFVAVDEYAIVSVDHIDAIGDYDDHAIVVDFDD